VLLDAQRAETTHDLRLLEIVVPDEVDVRSVQRGDMAPGRRCGQILGIPDDDRVDYQGQGGCSVQLRLVAPVAEALLLGEEGRIVPRVDGRGPDPEAHPVGR